MRGIPFGEWLLVTSLVRSLGDGIEATLEEASVLVYEKRSEKNDIYFSKMWLSP